MYPFLLFAFYMMIHVVQSGPILGIDFGSDTIKVVLVERAHMDILLDDQSSRKTPNVIAFRDSDRFFGKVAYDQMRWVPENVYKYLKDMLGATTLDSERIQANLPHISYGEKLFINDTVEGFPFVSIKHDEGNEISVLELVAMIFEKIGKVAKNTLGYPVRDVILTIPPFYTQQEKTALMNAAKLGGFNVLTLIDQTAAVALSYARKQVNSLDQSENIVFLDTGHSNLVISLYNFTNTTVFSNRKTKRIDAVQFNPLGRAWSFSLGGREYDLVLMNLIRDRILETYSLKELPEKAHRYLTRTVSKLKVTLSANKQAHYRIENVIENKDFSTVVTRDEFDSACAGLFESTTNFVLDFLKKNNISPKEITAFEMIGGSGRLPGLQEKLLPMIKKDSFDLHLNGDESSAFGAAIYSKIRNGVSSLKIRDNIEWDAHFSIYDIDTPEGKEPLSQTVSLFPKGTRVGTKKIFEFHHDRSFVADLKYVNCQNCNTFPVGSDQDIISYEISGFPKAGEYNFTKLPLVSVLVEMTTSGIFEILKAEANIEYFWNPSVPEPEIVDAKQDDTRKLEEKNNATGEDDVQNEEESEHKDENEEQDQPLVSGGDRATDIVKQKTILLQLNENNKHTVPTTLLSESRRKLWKLEEREQLKVRTEEKRNDLEALLFTTRDTLNYNEEFQAILKPEEQEKLKSVLENLLQWFDVEGYQATIELVNTKQKELNSILEPIRHRLEEYHAIPESINECKETLDYAKKTSPKIFEERTISEDEITHFTTLFNEIETYIKAQEALFLSFPQNENFLTTSLDLSNTCKPLISKLNIFERRTKRSESSDHPDL